MKKLILFASACLCALFQTGCADRSAKAGEMKFEGRLETNEMYTSDGRRVWATQMKLAPDRPVTLSIKSSNFVPEIWFQPVLPASPVAEVSNIDPRYAFKGSHVTVGPDGVARVVGRVAEEMTILFVVSSREGAASGKFEATARVDDLGGGGAGRTGGGEGGEGGEETDPASRIAGLRGHIAQLDAQISKAQQDAQNCQTEATDALRDKRFTHYSSMTAMAGQFRSLAGEMMQDRNKAARELAQLKAGGR